MVPGKDASLRLLVPWSTGARCVCASGEHVVSDGVQELAAVAGETLRFYQREEHAHA